MCPPPCGPKRLSNSSLVEHVKSKRISKNEVDDIISEGDFVCSYRMGEEVVNHEYEGCRQNLHMILHDAKTRVRVVGSRSRDYLAGYSTVVMNAACFPTPIVFLIRERC